MTNKELIIEEIKNGNFTFKDLEDLSNNLEVFEFNIYDFSKILLELFDYTAHEALSDGFLDEEEKSHLFEISNEFKKNIPILKQNKDFVANIKKDLNLLQQKYRNKQFFTENKNKSKIIQDTLFSDFKMKPSLDKE